MTASPALSDRRSPAFLMTYALANAGGTIGYVPLLTLLLPLKIERIAGEARLDLLALVAILGAVTASAANIAFGWLSDRSMAAGIGRRRWMVVGLATLAISYRLLASAVSPGALLGAVTLFQIAINALLAPLAAMMADEIPDTQKGVAGGLLALSGPLASVLTAALVSTDFLDENARLAVVPAVVALFVLPLLRTRERPVVGPSASGPTRPKRRNLAVAWVARLLVQIAGVVLSLYLLYYAESIVGGMPMATLAKRLGQMVALAATGASPVAVLVGRLSDRSGRRKPYLLAATALAAAGLAGMALVQNLRAAVIGYALYSIGAAIFLALHAGYATQLLPHPRHRGRDLGLVNLANTLPSVVAPPLAWLLATPQDFSALFLVLAGLTIAGGATTLGIRTGAQSQDDKCSPRPSHCP